MATISPATLPNDPSPTPGRPNAMARWASHVLLAVVAVTAGAARGQQAEPKSRAETQTVFDVPEAHTGEASKDVLTPAQWQAVDWSMDRGLAYLAARQRADGAFESPDAAQPGVTALAAGAFLAAGHAPGRGPYGKSIDAGIRFVLASQRPEGLLCHLEPEPAHVNQGASKAAIYSHGIAGVFLCEVYGLTDAATATRVRAAIDQALYFTRKRQTVARQYEIDKGGWRYLRTESTWWCRQEGWESDLSVTSWQLMFLRAAKNAGFHVPSEQIDQAMAYVKRCYDPREGSFSYLAVHDNFTRAMAGSGILSLSLGGLHETVMARNAGRWVLARPFDQYDLDKAMYHYSAYYATQGMFQLGGTYWSQFYPRLARTLLANQSPDGSWRSERGEHAFWGRTLTTALVVHALATPNQLLPVYQR